MKEHLNKLLEELHSELSDAEALDEQARGRLRGMAREIEDALGPDESKTLEPGALGRLEEAALGIESEYPRLSAVLGNIADTLSKLGI